MSISYDLTPKTNRITIVRTRSPRDYTCIAEHKQMSHWTIFKDIDIVIVFDFEIKKFTMLLLEVLSSRPVFGMACHTGTIFNGASLKIIIENHMSS